MQNVFLLVTYKHSIEKRPGFFAKEIVDVFCTYQEALDAVSELELSEDERFCPATIEQVWDILKVEIASRGKSLFQQVCRDRGPIYVGLGKVNGFSKKRKPKKEAMTENISES